MVASHLHQHNSSRFRDMSSENAKILSSYINHKRMMMFPFLNLLKLVHGTVGGLAKHDRNAYSWRLKILMEFWSIMMAIAMVYFTSWWRSANHLFRFCWKMTLIRRCQVSVNLAWPQSVRKQDSRVQFTIWHRYLRWFGVARPIPPSRRSCPRTSRRATGLSFV